MKDGYILDREKGGLEALYSSSFQSCNWRVCSQTGPNSTDDLALRSFLCSHRKLKLSAERSIFHHEVPLHLGSFRSLRKRLLAHGHFARPLRTYSVSFFIENFISLGPWHMFTLVCFVPLSFFKKMIIELFCVIFAKFFEGSNFRFNMTTASLRQSHCSFVPIPQDKSVYIGSPYLETTKSVGSKHLYFQ
jgi:hypothetical protein